MRCFHPLLRHASSGTSLDPFQILKVSKSASQAEIKQAYFSLVKKHHPDRPASSKPKGFEFKDIVAAYDILRDPVKRHQFTTYGMGWGDRPSSPHPDTGFNYENVHNPWRRRGDAQSKYRHAYQRPRYPSSNWDYGHSESTDFYSTSWQTPNSAEGREGMYTSNAAFIGVLAAMSALLYSVQFWRLAPPLPSSSGSSDSSSASFPHNFIAGDPKEAPIYKQSGMMRGRDKHHDEASKALGMARENAQKYGNARREGIRRRVRENALEAMESGKLGTGHILSSDLDREATNAPNEVPDPYRYVRHEVPQSERSFRKPATSERST